MNSKIYGPAPVLAAKKEPLIVASIGGRILHANQAAADLLDYSCEALCAWDVRELFSQDDRASGEDLLLTWSIDYFSPTSHHRHAVNVVSKDGTVLPLQVTVKAHCTRFGTLLEMVLEEAAEGSKQRTDPPRQASERARLASERARRADRGWWGAGSPNRAQGETKLLNFEEADLARLERLMYEVRGQVQTIMSYAERLAGGCCSVEERREALAAMVQKARQMMEAVTRLADSLDCRLTEAAAV